MWMVPGAVRGGDLGQVGWTHDLEELLLLVESQDLGADVLDARIDHVEAILSRIDVGDDSIVDVNECFFCVLHTGEHAVE